jgi:carbonic anhydrase
MKQTNLSRRSMLGLSGLTLLGSYPSYAKSPAQQKEEYPATADEALDRLVAGNERFVEGKTTHPNRHAERRAELHSKQQPFATILACSDSRVPPELLFDQGFGDLFIVRVAGNVIGTETLGSIQYALAHLKTPLFLVMGHEKCGAVAAALDALAGNATELAQVGALVKLIEPGLKDLDPSLKGDSRLEAAVESNVRWSMKQLRELPEAKKATEKKFRMIGSVYDLETGKVRLLKS